MGIIEEIKSLATTIGTDVKALRNDKVNKEDFDRVVKALEEIANGLHGTLGEEDGGHEGTHEGGHENANTNESHALNGYAEKIVKLLKDNHIPYLNSEEDNIESLKKWLENVNALIGNKLESPEVKYENGKTNVKITPVKYFGVKVDCVCDSGTVDETILSEKEYTGVTAMSIQPVDYYGATDKTLGKQTLNFEFLEKIGSLDKLQTKHKNGWSNDIVFEEIVDSNDYNIFDERMRVLYYELLQQKAKSIDSSKYFYANTAINSIQKFKLAGNVKLLILNKKTNDYGFESRYFLGASYLYHGADLETKPKYIAIIGSSNIDGFGEKIDNVEYESRDYTEEWNQRLEKVKVTKTAIYRWDSTKNKYMFESAEQLEDWLKEHPIDTL